MLAREALVARMAAGLEVLAVAVAEAGEERARRRKESVPAVTRGARAAGEARVRDAVAEASRTGGGVAVAIVCRGAKVAGVRDLVPADAGVAKELREGEEEIVAAPDAEMAEEEDATAHEAVKESAALPGGGTGREKVGGDGARCGVAIAAEREDEADAREVPSAATEEGGTEEERVAAERVV